jgi:hypothetical protein
MRTTLARTEDFARKVDRCTVCGWLQSVEQLEDRSCAVLSEVPPHPSYPIRRESWYRAREAHGVPELRLYIYGKPAPRRHLPGYLPADNRFYRRANAGQNVDSGHGHHANRTQLSVRSAPSYPGPVRLVCIDVESAIAAGVWPPRTLEDVRDAIAWFATGPVEVRPPYTFAEAGEIIRRAERNARDLAPEEAKTALRNRRAYDAARRFT